MILVTKNMFMKKNLSILFFFLIFVLKAQVGINTNETTYTDAGEVKEAALTINGDLRIRDLSGYDKNNLPIVYNNEQNTLAIGSPAMHKVDYIIDMAPNLKAPGNDGKYNPLRLISLNTQIPGDKYDLYIASAVPLMKGDNNNNDTPVSMTLNGKSHLNGVEGCAAKINEDGNWHIYADWALQWDDYVLAQSQYRNSSDFKYENHPEYCLDYGRGVDYQNDYKSDMILAYGQKSALWKITVYVIDKNYVTDLGQYKNTVTASYSGSNVYPWYKDNGRKRFYVFQSKCPLYSGQRDQCINLCPRDDYELSGGRIRNFYEFNTEYPSGGVIPGPRGLPDMKEEYTKNPDGHYFFRRKTSNQPIN